MPPWWNDFIKVLSLFLLFFLMCGLSATVDFKLFKSKFEAKRGIAVGVFCQFIVMPFLGFTAAKMFDLPSHLGIALMVMTSSPGGAFSGLWCSIFNADLALSVAMTTCSTICSIFMLPLNLFIYVNSLYGTDVVIPWATLSINIAVAIAATVIGLFIGAKVPAHKNKFNAAGNISGLLLIVIAAIPKGKADSVDDGSMSGRAADLMALEAGGWCKNVFTVSRPAEFYFAVAMPCCLGLFVALGAASLPCLGLIKEERVAISVETLYQNTGLALSIALSAFDDPCAITAATGVPLFYGGVEAVLLPALLAVAWKMGWTYAPAGENTCKAITGNYQPTALDALKRKRNRLRGELDDLQTPKASGSTTASVLEPDVVTKTQELEDVTTEMTAAMRKRVIELEAARAEAMAAAEVGQDNYEIRKLQWQLSDALSFLATQPSPDAESGGQAGRAGTPPRTREGEGEGAAEVAGECTGPHCKGCTDCKDRPPNPWLNDRDGTVPSVMAAAAVATDKRPEAGPLDDDPALP